MIRAIVISDVAGTLMAGLIGLAGVGGGLWLTHEGKALGGLSSLFGTLATLLGVFIYQSRQSSRATGDETKKSKK